MSKEAKPTHYLVAILILLAISLFSFTSVYSAPTETNQTSFWKTIYCNTIGDWFNSPRCPLREDIDTMEYNTVTLVDDEPNTQINNTDTYKTESNLPSINKITINRDSPTTLSPTNIQTPIFDLSILNNYVTRDYLSLHNSSTNSSDYVTRDFLSRQVGAIGDSFGRSLSDLSTRLTALIPSAASITNWDSFFTTPSTRILAGTNLSWDGNTLNAVGSAGGVSLSLSNNIFGQSSLAPTTTQNLAISGIGTSTFAGGLESWRQISSPYFQATSTTATSTFAGGITAGGSTGLTVLQNGNVGVGTASPGYALEISKTDSVNNAVTNILALTHLTSGTAAVGMGSGLLFRVANSVYGITVTGASISSNQSNQSVINHPLIFSNTVGNILAERMRLSDQGNLLIGTTTDTSRSLFVSGTSEIDARLYVNKGLVVENTVSKHQVYSIGDSLTYSNGSGYFETQLNTLLGNTWIVVNRGISGQTTAQMLARFQTDIIDRGDAEYITIWGGINDVLGGLSAASIESNLQQMYTMAYNAGLKVVAINISPFKGYSGWTADKQTVLDAVNTWITSSATDVDYVIDIYSVLEDGSNPDALLATYDGGDHLHLSVSGYNQVGSSVYNGSVWTAASAPTNSLFVTGGGTFTGKVGIGTTSPTNKFGVSDGFIDVGGTTGGYKIDNRLILQASSTNQSTLVGYGAGASLLAGGIRNVAVGYQALYVATSTDYNSAIGYRALASNTIGERNTSLGYGVLEFNTTGNYNNAIGLNTLNSNTTGSANNAQGYQALFYNKTGSYNSALGHSALLNNASATNTTAVGYNAGVGTALYNSQGGVYLGYQAGYSAGTGGDYNTLLGYQSGYNVSTGKYNIIIGQNVNATSSDSVGGLNIGNVLYGTGMYTGGSVSATAIATGRIGVATTTPWRTLGVTGTVGFDGLTGATGAGSICLSATKELVYNAGSDACLPSLRSTKHDINNLSTSSLSALNLLTPVSFIYNQGDNRTRYGFIAEDVSQIDTHLATYNDKGEISGIDDRALIALAIGSIKELDVKLRNIITSVGEWVFNKITATLGVFERVETESIKSNIVETKTFESESVKSKSIEIQTASISDGIQMTDKVTGQVYCISLSGGNLNKSIGPCSTATTTVIISPTPTPEPSPTATPDPTPTPTPTPSTTPLPDSLTPSPDPTITPIPEPSPIPEPTPIPSPTPVPDLPTSTPVPEPVTTVQPVETTSPVITETAKTPASTLEATTPKL